MSVNKRRRVSTICAWCGAEVLARVDYAAQYRVCNSRCMRSARSYKREHGTHRFVPDEWPQKRAPKIPQTARARRVSEAICRLQRKHPRPDVPDRILRQAVSWARQARKMLGHSPSRRAFSARFAGSELENRQRLDAIKWALGDRYSVDMHIDKYFVISVRKIQ